ncbi:unnamed protein product [Oncorhynchus mykiss]|uniref:P/Homo B domain-containing protein n=1 Tax=Oncorhynchus mykiss TaxID=8022 RepID=A0A060W5M9_ONCMY|nr:unnamed protein product [Oncorhynchus mykiss]
MGAPALTTATAMATPTAFTRCLLEKGTLPFYSEPCSAILTTTYSGGSFQNHRIVTTDLHQSCTSDHTGTSASAPLAAGIIALALEANPRLTWRDVQHLHQDWQIFERMIGGLMVLVDLSAITMDMGSWMQADWWTWPVNGKKSNLKRSAPLTSLPDPSCHGTRNWIRSLEHIQARLTLTYSRRGDLSITLISPKKTISNLLTTRPYDKTSAGFSDWAFMSTHCWDEDPSGYWVLQIENNGDSNNRGFLLKFQLELHGTAEHMIGRRMERAVVQQCAVRNSDGGCEGRLLHYSFPEFSLQ